VAPDVLVIYHGPICFDGFTAAYAARRQLGEQATYIPMNYGEEPPDVTGCAVYIVDFSFPRETLEAMARKAARIVVLDHHVTAAKDLEGLEYAQFDMNKSGARLAWDFFMKTQPTNLIKYVEDRDLWRFALPHSRAINAYIATIPMTWDDWRNLESELAGDVRHVVRAGEAVLRYQSNLISAHQRTAREINFEGHNILIANASHLFSEVATALSVNRPFGMTYRDNLATGYREWSLRSQKEEVDVSEVAKRHGGGGHKHAAGYREPIPGTEEA
jgi:uncharacterized protein